VEELFCATVIREVYNSMGKLLKFANLMPTPILYQHLIEVLFWKLLDDQCTATSQSTSVSSEITEHEGNAIRYAAGYVRNFRRRLKGVNTNARMRWYCALWT